jgi:hypothetical protein
MLGRMLKTFFKLFFWAKFYGHYVDMVKTSNIENPMSLLLKILGKEFFFGNNN